MKASPPSQESRPIATAATKSVARELEDAVRQGNEQAKISLLLQAAALTSNITMGEVNNMSIQETDSDAETELMEKATFEKAQAEHYVMCDGCDDVALHHSSSMIDESDVYESLQEQGQIIYKPFEVEDEAYMYFVDVGPKCLLVVDR